jgi:Glycosyltransferase family 18
VSNVVVTRKCNTVKLQIMFLCHTFSFSIAHSVFFISSSLAGDPLTGPSAVDAVVNGAVFINPHYSQPKENFFTSQHPFLEEAVGSPHVCEMSWELYKQDKAFESIRKCVLHALEVTASSTPVGFHRQQQLNGGGGSASSSSSSGLPPLIPVELTEPVYLQRLKRIVGPALGWKEESDGEESA